VYLEGLNGPAAAAAVQYRPADGGEDGGVLAPGHPCSSRSRSKVRFPLQAKSYLLLGFYSSATGLSGRFTEDFFFGAYRAFGASLVQVRPASEPAIEQGKHRRHEREHAANRYWRFESFLSATEFRSLEILHSGRRNRARLRLHSDVWRHRRKAPSGRAY
jgi:hypothetical protein